MSDFSKELEKVIEFVREAGIEVMKIYDTDFEVDMKQNDSYDIEEESPLTKADLTADKMLREGLEEFGYGYVTEESGKVDKGNGMFWIIDPLDGTKDFIQKTGEFSLMVALLKDGKPVLGVVYVPAIDKLYYATEGNGCYLVEGESEPKRLDVSERAKTEEFRLVISRNHFRDADKAVADRLGIEEFKKMGSVGIKFGSIAEGLAELCIYTTPHMGVWDDCASHVLLKEAGGEVFDIDGNEPSYDLEGLKMSKGFIGTNGKNKEKVLESIKAGM